MENICVPFGCKAVYSFQMSMLMPLAEFQYHYQSHISGIQYCTTPLKPLKNDVFMFYVNSVTHVDVVCRTPALQLSQAPWSLLASLNHQSALAKKKKDALVHSLCFPSNSFPAGASS